MCESPPVSGAAGATAAIAASTPSESAIVHQSSEPVTTGAGGATEGVYESPPVSDADGADDAGADAAGADAAGADTFVEKSVPDAIGLLLIFHTSGF